MGPSDARADLIQRLLRSLPVVYPFRASANHQLNEVVVMIYEPQGIGGNGRVEFRRLHGKDASGLGGGRP